MKFSYQWLKELVPRIPTPDALVDLLTFHSFEIESVDKKGKDHIIDIKILPDRISDAGSHWGLAREIAAVAGVAYGNPAKKLSPKIFGSKASATVFSLDVDDRAVCSRYIGCAVSNVSVSPSSQKDKDRLALFGMNAINSLVDFANIAMLETGQPLHVFDMDKISGRHIVVRRAHKGEKILALDNVEYTLDESMTVIADDAGPLAIAGIKGGKRAEVDAHTKNILVEAAFFDSAAIRKTVRALKFSTDASTRFTQGIDPNASELGAARLVDLILKNTKGKVVGHIDHNPYPQTPRTISLRKEKVEAVLGVSIDEKQMVSALERLGFVVRHMKGPREVLLKNAKKLVGRPYYFGASAMYDAPRRFDCSSLMVYLFRSIGSQLPRMSFEQYAYGTPVAEDKILPGDLVFRERAAKEDDWKHDIGHVGLYIGGGKVIDASSKKGKVAVRTLKEFQKEARRYFGARRVLHENHVAHYLVTVPTSRRDIVAEENLVEEIGRMIGYDKVPETPFAEAFSYRAPADEIVWRDRIKQFFVSSGFYEADTYDFVGREEIERFGGVAENHWELENPTRPEFTYLRRMIAPTLVNIVSGNYQHHQGIKLFATGDVFLPERFTKDPKEAEEGHISGVIWGSEKNTDAVLSAKGTLDALFESMGIDSISTRDVKESERPYVHPHRSAEILLQGKSIGYVGSLHPLIAQAYAIKKGEVVVFELALPALIAEAEGEFEYQAPSKYPSVIRDISVLVSEDTRVSDVEDIVENTGGELLWQSELFDLYEGENIQSGMRSMAFHLIFQSESRTLRDAEVEEAVKKITEALESKGWEVRK